MVGPDLGPEQDMKRLRYPHDSYVGVVRVDVGSRCCLVMALLCIVPKSGATSLQNRSPTRGRGFDRSNSVLFCRYQRDTESGFFCDDYLWAKEKKQGNKKEGGKKNTNDHFGQTSTRRGHRPACGHLDTMAARHFGRGLLVTHENVLEEVLHSSPNPLGPQFEQIKSRQPRH